jgi:hypothetical protein
MNTIVEGPIQLHEEEAQSDRFQPETPFLDTRFSSEAWSQGEASETQEGAAEQWTPELESPFLSESHGEAPLNLEAQQLEETMGEYFDRDFNEAVANLAHEAAAQAEDFARGNGEPEAERMLHEWIAPLAKASERLFESAGEAAGQQQLESLDEAQFDSVFEAFAPSSGTVAPHFEEFFGKVWRKVKSIARSAARLAKKGLGALAKLGIPIGLFLKKLGALVRPLLNRVIRFAINKLPSGVQPLVVALGRKMGILREGAAEAGETYGQTEAPATAEAETIAHEFDVSVASLLFASDEADSEAVLHEAAQETQPETEANPIGELDAARERFVTQFSQLQNGENAAPVVQQFIPAILPLLRIGIKVVGRNSVVNFLARYLAKLIQRYVGPSAATMLSRALVDVGLRLITLEAEMEPPPRTAARAVAATLEDAMRRVASFGFEQFEALEQNLEDQRLLETVASEAFFEAAIAHFPAQLLDVQRLEEREMHLESPGQQEVWAYRPRPRYKKYTKVFELTVTKQGAAGIRTFANQPLDAFLRSRGVRLPAKVKVHLYESIPGTTLSRIALLEKGVPGLGSSAQSAWSKIHPLTVAAAQGLQLPPGLGRDVAEDYLQTRSRIAVGQRFYYIEIPYTGGGGGASQVNVTIDLRASQVRASVYFSEADAQRVVASGPAAGPMTAIRLAQGLLGATVNSIRGGASRHVRLIREATGELQGEEFLGKLASEAAKKVLFWLLEELAKALLQMLKAALIRYLNARFTEFTTATRNPASGVSLIFTFNHPGLRVLHVALAGRIPNMSDVRAAARALQFPSAQIVPAFVVR